MFEGAFSPFHWLVVLAIALVVFGPKRVPEIGKNLGTAIRGFREALKGEEPPAAPPETPKPSGPTGIVDGSGPKA
jgi:sec-independent protein translocase protein TatA